MTLKDVILKFFCLTPERDTFPPEIDIINRNFYKIVYTTNGKRHKSYDGLICDHCGSAIKGGFRIIKLSHYVIENRIATFLSEELKPFCDRCYVKRILLGTKYGKTKEACMYYYKC